MFTIQDSAKDFLEREKQKELIIYLLAIWG